MASGVLGKGTYHSIIAGKGSMQPPKSYHVSYFEEHALKVADQLVKKNFLIRDDVFYNKFPHAAAVNGHFKLTPKERHKWHSEEVMPAIRDRTFIQKRIEAQNEINRSLGTISDAQLKYKTSDFEAYTNPSAHKGTVRDPNYWQHHTRAHVVPRVEWQRFPELGGITRVTKPYTLS